MVKVFDKTEDVDPQEGEEDGTKTEEGAEDTDPESLPEDNADKDGQGEARDPEEGGKEDRGADEPPKGEGGAEIAPPFDPVAFEQRITKTIEEKLKPKEEEKPRELTEDQWAAEEERSGMTRQTIQYFGGIVDRMADKIISNIENKYGGRLSKFETTSALDDLSKEQGFSDAKNHSANVSEFLNKYFDPKFHSDPGVLKSAVIHSRGLGMSKTITKIRGEGERNKKITGPGRPSSPTSGGTSSSKPLSESQKQVAALMPGGETEYRKFMKKGPGLTQIER
jgi:hypothetical protein